MYCRNCGNEIADNEKFCGKCGTPKGGVANAPVVNGPYVQQPTGETDSDRVLYALLGIFLPLVCLILSLCTKKDKPEAAKLGIIISCIRLVINVILFVIYFILIFLSYSISYY